MQLICVNKFLPLLLVGLVPSTKAVELDLLYGHYEIQTDYRPGSGWWLGQTYNQNDDFNDRSQIRRLEASTTKIVAPPRAITVGNAATSFLLPPGQPLWLLNQGFQVGNHFLGMRVVIDPFVFQTRVGTNYTNSGTGSVSMRLASVTGSGPDRSGKFALWESDPFAGQIVYFNSNDGITADDEIPTLPVGTHSHFNWGFTKPGEYKISIEAFGRLRPDGDPTSMTETFTFIVPHTGRLAALDAELCVSGTDIALVPGDRALGVAFGPRRSFVETTATTSGPPGAAWQTPLRLAAAGWAVPDHAGISAILASSGADLGSGARLTLRAHRGPGHVIALADSGAVLFDSSDGFGPADELDLAAVPVTGTLYFTEKGLHTLEFAGDAQTEANSMTKDTGLVIRCGAGLPVTYTFADWADSHERTHALPPGTLASPSGDFNGDGRTHRLEYLLDAADVSPVTGGSATRALLEPGTGFGRMTFLRDLYKDPLLGTGLQLQSGFSGDLTAWTYLTASKVGFPLEFFETGADQGNARSLLMMRAIRRQTPVSGRNFFRLRGQ